MKEEKSRKIIGIHEVTADVLIVGTGVAGLHCALELPGNLDIRMITKDKMENSDSYLAQGGISAMKNPEDHDTYYCDTMRAGHYKNNPESVENIVSTSPEIMRDLMDYGVEFDRNPDGTLNYAREGGHSTSRILHHKDITGKEIMDKLIAAIRNRRNVRIDEYTKMLDIISEGNVCRGIVVEGADHRIYPIYARIVVFATGGIGGLFRHSTNFPHITGDALAIALKHGIEVQDVQYIQIHPTVFYSKEHGRRFLISEAVRGEGGILLNPLGERFTNELEPRDVVTAAIRKEMKKFGTEYVFLSMRNVDPETVRAKLPNIYRYCLEQGYDLTKDNIPVTPAQHYFMGGIRVDQDGRTSMEGLFAVGEAGCSGVHGANRLGSNSLLESLVFSKRAAAVIAEILPEIELKEIDVDISAYHPDDLQKEYRMLIMEEIKRRDPDFYEQWCTE